MNRLALLAAAMMTFVAAGASAQPAYRKDDILKHFAPKDLGATRGLCIGTEAECSVAGRPAAPPTREAFDLVVTFDLDSDVLTEQAKANLAEFAKALKDPALATRSFLVEGHTDARGTESHNLALSERRAAAVVRFLNEQGVTKANLLAKGVGMSRPRTADPFDAANRRVETRLRLE